MSKLVVCVEGEGDVAAAPNLISRLLLDLPADGQGALTLDTNFLEVGDVRGLTGTRQHEWLRYLEVAKRRRPLGAVLLMLDGDVARVENQPFCAMAVARTLAERAKEAGAGTLFSVAVVFLYQEFESLLIASHATLPGLAPDVRPPDLTKRGAKEWLAKNREGGYKESRDQLPLTRAADFGLIRAANLRSFRRLETALLQLALAVQTGPHVATPSIPPPQAPDPL